MSWTKAELELMEFEVVLYTQQNVDYGRLEVEAAIDDRLLEIVLAGLTARRALREQWYHTSCLSIGNEIVRFGKGLGDIQDRVANAQEHNIEFLKFERIIKRLVEASVRYRKVGGIHFSRPFNQETGTPKCAVDQYVNPTGL
jgi:hypothetical protein